jgi:hypothetical protein
MKDSAKLNTNGTLLDEQAEDDKNRIAHIYNLRYIPYVRLMHRLPAGV